MLKNVYFGCMEFKVVAYIIIGIIWLFSKMLNTKEKKAPLPSPLPPVPVPVPVAGKPMPRKKLQPRATKKESAAVIQPVSLESKVGLEAAAESRLRGSVLTNRDPETVIKGVVQLEDDEWQDNGSFGSQIASEIKNGTIDWKRAVVINELLRPRV